MKKNKKLVIIGDSAFAEVAYECFSRDSDYEVVGFSVESAYLKQDSLFGLPVVAFETIHEKFSPQQVDFFAAVAYTRLNRLRTRLYQAALAKGFHPASYISSRAFVWPNAEIGEHCFIFEDNTLQPFVKIGNNVILWSGNHIGHHSLIQDHCFIASQVVISGFCTIGRYTFIGVNATVVNNLRIGEDNWIGPGVLLVRDTAPDQIFKIAQPPPAKIGARHFFKVGGD